MTYVFLAAFGLIAVAVILEAIDPRDAILACAVLAALAWAL